MTGVPSQFGVDEERASSLAARMALSSHRLRGVHLYMGSNVLAEDDLVHQFAIGTAIARRLVNYGEDGFIVDLGGGFGHPFATPGDPPVGLGCESECPN